MKNIFQNAGIATLARVLVNAIGLVVVSILSRVLGPEDFGLYNTIFAFLFLFNILSDMGLYTLLVREISKENADEKSIVGNLVTLRLVLVAAALVLAVIAVWVMPYPYVVRIGVLVGSISIIGSSLVQILIGVFQKYLKLKYLAIADFASRIVQLAGVWLVISRGEVSVVSFVWVVVVSEVVHVFLTVFFARRLIEFNFEIDFEYWKKSLRTTFPIAVSLVFVLVYFKIDTVMLSIMRPAYEVGVYSIAYKVLEIVIFFPAMYVGLIMPSLSRNANNLSEFSSIFKKAFNIILLGAISSTVLLLIFAPIMSAIVGGKEYLDSVGAIRILSLASALIFFGNLGGNALVALDLQKKGMWIYAAGALVNVCANLIFIPSYGYIAAAWTTVGTELIVTAGMFWLIRRRLLLGQR